jgi:hypothetical protein
MIKALNYAMLVCGIVLISAGLTNGFTTHIWEVDIWVVAVGVLMVVIWGQEGSIINAKKRLYGKIEELCEDNAQLLKFQQMYTPVSEYFKEKLQTATTVDEMEAEFKKRGYMTTDEQSAIKLAIIQQILPSGMPKCKQPCTPYDEYRFTAKQLVGLPPTRA